MTDQETATSLCEALYAIQDEVGPLTPDAENPHFKSKFASLAAIKQKVDPIAWKHGVYVRQELGTKDGESVLLHRTYFNNTLVGTETIVLPVARENDPQAYGSAVTYIRRYAYTTGFGLVTEIDDDGNAASQPEKKQTTKRQSPLRAVNNSTTVPADF